VSVAVIVSGLADGGSVEDICRSYEIGERDVRAALAFAAERVEGERIVTLPRRLRTGPASATLGRQHLP